jgi:hypothetical protein
MTDWSAVLIGFLSLVVLGVLGLVVPGLGQFFAALVGGFTAGYLAGGDALSGFWHGLLAGSLGSIIVGVIIWVAISFLSFSFGPVAGAISSVIGLGAVIIVFVVALITAVESGVAGAVGATLSG